MISQTIYKILTDNVGLSALIGTKIYPVKTPETISEPFMIYMVSERPENTKDNNNLDIIDLDISLFSSKYENAMSIQTAIRAALDFYSGTMTNKIDAIYFEDSRNAFDEDAELYRIDSGFKIRLKK